MSLFTNFRGYVELDPGFFVLTMPLRWDVGRIGSGLEVVVPAGFKFDFSSPRWLRWLIDPRDRRYLLAAAVHDFLLLQGWSANRAAMEFYHGLKAMRVGRVERFLLTAAVLTWTSL